MRVRTGSRVIGIAVAGVLLAHPSAASAATPMPGEEPYLVEVVRSEVADVSEHLADMGAEVADVTTAVVGTVAADLTAAQAAAVAAQPGVIRVEPDALVTVLDESSSPTGSATQPGADWGLDRLDQASLPLDGTYTYDASAGAGVRVYIVDTGVSPNAAQFGSRLVAGFTAVNDGRGTADCHGHGTHVAGTVASTTYGVAKAATIVPVRVAGCSGSGYMSDIVAGLDWIETHHPAGTPGVVNISMGGSRTQSVNDALAALVAQGIVVAVAAGNSSADACGFSPSSAPAALTVGATASNDARASYSNVGPCVDLFAPGSTIGSVDYLNPSGVAYKSGTSMASPHVAGVAALYLGARPSATGAQASAALLAGALQGKVSDTQGTANLLLSATLVPAPSTPGGLTGAMTSTTATVTWSSPDATAPDRYTVVWRKLGTAAWTTVSTTSATTTLTGLTPSTRYDVAVTAANATGTSLAASAVLTTAAPPAPGGLTATSTATTGTLTWTAPSEAGGIVGYRVQRSLDGIAWTTVTSVPATVTVATVPKLAPGVAYQVKVQSVDATGAGNAATTTVQAAMPGAPTALTQTASTLTSSTVTWTAPVSGAITGYTVQRHDGTAWVTVVTTSAKVRSVTVTGLQPGMSVPVRVAAVSGAQTAAWATLTASTKAVPSAPAVGGTSTPTSVTVTWSAPTTSPELVASWVVQRQGPTGWVTVASPRASARSFTLSQLAPSTDVPLRVAARTAGGAFTGEWGSVTLTSADAPSAPTPVAGSAAGLTSLVVSWASPQTSAGWVTGYQISVSTNGGATWSKPTTVKAAVLSATVARLAPATAYLVKVVPVAGKVVGDAATATVSTPVAAAAPASFAVSAATVSTATVSWTAPPSTAGTVTGYLVQRLTASGWVTVATTAASARSVTVKGLAPGSESQVRVAAKVGAYTGTWVATTVTTATNAVVRSS